MHDWKDLRYLRSGTPRQQHAHRVLDALALWPALRAFDPVLAGTVPLGVDVPESDLDVICHVPVAHQAAFERLLRDRYGHLAHFQQERTSSRGRACVVSRFSCEGEALEVFGQALPTRQQYAYRHLVVEAAVLQAGGEAWRRAVHRLKRHGLKTEPAFAALLGLAGDPYEALLSLENKTSAELTALVAECPLPLLTEPPVAPDAVSNRPSEHA